MGREGKNKKQTPTGAPQPLTVHVALRLHHITPRKAETFTQDKAAR